MLSMSASSSTAAPWTELPDDLTANILQRLDIEDIVMGAQLVCSTWWRVCKNPAMWRMIELKLDGFEVDNFLNYIVQRSSQLLRLTLKTNYTIMTAEALKKLPQLEELHLITMHRLSPEDFETIGFACPLLKSLTYTNRW
ncbi:putative F-box/LRR-repeat protein 9, partial [Salvia hispanica]|uniref:putative F-box/LRR-repeat protein 9 n=1 Tax=Salvia hispanica TaxID=49212 RepID=UPI0020098A0D